MIVVLETEYDLSMCVCVCLVVWIDPVVQVREVRGESQLEVQVETWGKQEDVSRVYLRSLA
jgi:hypothetical protein